jgi:hypothetical protein
MPGNRYVKNTVDGGLIIHQDLAAAVDANNVDDDIRSAADVSVCGRGASFGESVSDSDLAFAACREPVAHFLTYGVAAEVTDKWFIVDDADTKDPDTKLDGNVQTVLTQLNFRETLTESLIQARIYRKCLIVGAFDDASKVEDLKYSLKKGALLKQFETYPKTENCKKLFEYGVDQTDDNKNSLRYGKPLIYRIDRGGGNILFVHFSRCIELDNKFSVLTPIFDDLVCGRNIRWGAAQWLYRTGGGFPVIGFPRGTKIETLEAYCNSGAFNNLMNRSYIALAQNSRDENDGMTLEFKGAASSALDPAPFFKSNLEQIAIATGIPQAKLVGAQAGAVTGSNVNMQDYFKVISRIQNGELTRVTRQVIDWLAESGQVKGLKAVSSLDTKNVTQTTATVDYRSRTVTNYVIVWNSGFELSELDRSTIDLNRVRANQGKLDYMTVDEVRQEENLEELPNKEGEKIKGSALSEIFETPPQPATSTENGKGETSENKLQAADKFLLIDLKQQSVKSKRR